MHTLLSVRSPPSFGPCRLSGIDTPISSRIPSPLESVRSCYLNLQYPSPMSDQLPPEDPHQPSRGTKRRRRDSSSPHRSPPALAHSAPSYLDNLLAQQLPRGTSSSTEQTSTASRFPRLEPPAPVLENPYPVAVPTSTTQTTPKQTRRAKAHVASACVNCKRKHLGCDSSRPCKRCVASGKEKSCFDGVHRKRGRPPLKAEEGFLRIRTDDDPFPASTETSGHSDHRQSSLGQSYTIFPSRELRPSTDLEARSMPDFMGEYPRPVNTSGTQENVSPTSTSIMSPPATAPLSPSFQALRPPLNPSYGLSPMSYSLGHLPSPLSGGLPGTFSDPPGSGHSLNTERFYPARSPRDPTISLPAISSVTGSPQPPPQIHRSSAAGGSLSVPVLPSPSPSRYRLPPLPAALPDYSNPRRHPEPPSSWSSNVYRRPSGGILDPLIASVPHPATHIPRISELRSLDEPQSSAPPLRLPQPFLPRLAPVQRQETNSEVISIPVSAVCDPPHTLATPTSLPSASTTCEEQPPKRRKMDLGDIVNN